MYNYKSIILPIMMICQSFDFINSYIYNKKIFYISSNIQMKKNNYVENIELPLCINCKHFIEHKTNYPYDDLPNDQLYSKCNLFYDINLITGKKINFYTKKCREDNNLCGEKGKFFISDN